MTDMYVLVLLSAPLSLAESVSGILRWSYSQEYGYLYESLRICIFFFCFSFLSNALMNRSGLLLPVVSLGSFFTVHTVYPVRGYRIWLHTGINITWVCVARNCPGRKLTCKVVLRRMEEESVIVFLEEKL